MAAARWNSDAGPVAAPCRVPHRGGRQLGCHQHVGAVMLDGLERGDGPPELDPLLGVGHRCVRTGPHQTHRLRRAQRAGQRSGASGRAREDVGPVDRRRRHGDVGSSAGRVEVVCPRHRDAGRVRPEHHQVVAGPHEKQVGRRPAQEDATVAVEHPVAEGEGPAPTERGHAGAVRQSGEQRHLLGVVATVGDHRRGQHRREEGPWRDLTAQLLQHDDELAQPRTCATVLLGEVDAEPTERRHLVPEGRPRLDVGLEQRPVGRDGAMRDDQRAARWHPVAGARR